MSVLAALFLLALTFTQISCVTLQITNCPQQSTTLAGNGTFVITNSTPSCKWTLNFAAGMRFRFESTSLCLDCADTVLFKDTTGRSILDIATVNSNGVPSDKICNKPALYCTGSVGTNEVIVDVSPVTLEFTRAGSTNVDVAFRYYTYPKTAPPTTRSVSPTRLVQYSSTTPNAASRVSFGSPAFWLLVAALWYR